jgi:glycosyltransferase involved in cell wall biosynthesis
MRERRSEPLHPLRVAHLIDDLGRGGTQTWLSMLVEGLHRLGYEQRVYCLRAIALTETLEKLNRWAPVEVIGTHRLWALEGLVRIYRALRSWRPDIVQTQLPTSDVVGRTLGRLAGVPAVISSIRTRNVRKSSWQLLWDRVTARMADRVVFNSRAVIPFAVRHEGVRLEQAVYIPNGVRRPADPSGPISLPTRGAALRSRLGLPEQAGILGTVARLHPQKGHRYLLEAFARVIRLFPLAGLLVIGDGPLRKRLERQAAGLGLARCVRFLGDRSDVTDLLPLMDIYVHPSLFEGMPNAVMEAMAAARPVIATGVDGTPELIVDGQTGWLVQPADPEDLAERMTFALRNPKEAHRIGLAAAERIQTRFSADRMIGGYHALYQRLVSAGKGLPTLEDRPLYSV